MMYDCIYLSPHLDDAALSCGGQISQQTAAAQRVLIVTIMAGDPPRPDMSGELSGYARELHERWQLADDIVAARRREDVAACGLLGADWQHWTIPDCIYRTDPDTGAPHYTDWSQITGPVHRSEGALITQVAARMAALPEAKQIVMPLAVGNHVDHQIVRQAAELGLEAAGCYYEDYPYVCDEALLRAVISSDRRPWQARVVPLTETAVQTKIAAIAAYTSQLSTFFKDQADLENRIRAFTTASGGERFWQRQEN